MEKGTCLHTLKKHDDPVYSVSFSPDGKYLASGSFDKWIYIWSTSDGSIIKQYKGSSGIFEVCWNKDGSKLAASLANNTVSAGKQSTMATYTVMYYSCPVLGEFFFFIYLPDFVEHISPVLIWSFML